MIPESSELRAERDRLADLAAALDRSLSGQADGTTVLVVKTIQESSYPTTASCSYACQVQTPGGAETEGAAGSLGATSATLYAYNLGSSIPPQGTLLLATQIGDRWVIHYNG